MKPATRRFLPLNLAFLALLVSLILQTGFHIHSGTRVVALVFLLALFITIIQIVTLPATLPAGRMRALGIVVRYLIGVGVLLAISGVVFQLTTKAQLMGQWLLRAGAFCLVAVAFILSGALLFGVLRPKRPNE